MVISIASTTFFVVCIKTSGDDDASIPDCRCVDYCRYVGRLGEKSGLFYFITVEKLVVDTQHSQIKHAAVTILSQLPNGNQAVPMLSVVLVQV